MTLKHFFSEIENIFCLALRMEKKRKLLVTGTIFTYLQKYELYKYSSNSKMRWLELFSWAFAGSNYRKYLLKENVFVIKEIFTSFKGSNRFKYDLNFECI